MRGRSHSFSLTRGVGAVGVLILLAAACAPAAAPSPTAAPQKPAPAAQPAAKASAAQAIEVPDWWVGSDQAYTDLVKAAQQEGKLVLWAHPDPAGDDVYLGPFEKKYGIDIEHTEFRTREVFTKAIQEHAAGKVVADVMEISAVHIPGLVEQEVIQKLDFLREDTRRFKEQPELLSPGGYAAIDYTHPRGLCYNKDQVDGESIQTYDDLLDPKWQGKIADDTDVKHWIILAQDNAWGMEKTKQYLRNLAKQNIRPHPSNTNNVQMTAAGDALMSPAVIYGICAFEFRDAPVAWKALRPYLPLDPLAFSIHAKAEHPNAAKLFLYWALAGDVYYQKIWEFTAYGHALIVGNPLQQVLPTDVKPILWDWQWAIDAGKQGVEKEFIKILGYN